MTTEGSTHCPRSVYGWCCRQLKCQNFPSLTWAFGVQNCPLVDKRNNYEKLVCPTRRAPAETVTRFSINGKVDQLTTFPGTGLENVKAKVYLNVSGVCDLYSAPTK